MWTALGGGHRAVEWFLTVAGSEIADRVEHRRRASPHCDGCRTQERGSLACLGVAVVMTHDHDFDRDEITHRNVQAVVKWFTVTNGSRFAQLSEHSHSVQHGSSV